jgi:hypothetical protein
MVALRARSTRSLMEMGIVDDHLAASRRRIRTCYFLVVGENVLDLLWPFAIGLAIDGLIDGAWAGIAVFVALSLGQTATSFIRQRYQTRTFNHLYADIAADLVAQQRAAGVDTASVSGRTELAADYVDFLDEDIPLAITAAFAVVGSLIMLFLYDPLVGAAAALVAVPVIVLNRRLMARSEGLFRELNDLAEIEVDVIDRGRPAESHRHFGILGRRWVRLSDTEAASWGFVEVVAVALWVFTLVRVTSGTVDVGEIIAIIAYVAFYTAGFDEAPGVLQRLTRLGDIKRRLDDQTSSAIDSSDDP